VDHGTAIPIHSMSTLYNRRHSLSSIYTAKTKRKTVNYRKIYEQYYGAIPYDEFGRRYEIHHIDGNPNNNEINNLKCISIKEHYEIHYKQKDWGACLLIARAMKISPEEKKNLARLAAIKRLEEGTHNFLNKDSNENRVKAGTHNFLGGEIGGRTSRKRVAEGTHIFLGGEVQRKQILDGKNKLVGGKLQKESAKRLLEEGRHHSQKVNRCLHCNREILGNAFYRYHGNKCKLNEAQ